ncbi:lipase 1-like [Cydia amplana]|uniref:lipase 1-like n=1 Tax=Cydia amplana TaxID=1869771 RepID=UPI002FE51BC9
MNFTEFSRECGVYAEEFEVVTEDGYILTLFHIPGKKNPVLLMHGIGDTSNTWVLRGNKSLAISLAREGYDVWAGNIRGNRYGRRHVRLNPDTDETFWDFSFHQVGLFDWPAMIDRVLKETKQTKLNAIAHSQGTTSFFVLASLKPEYNEKVELLIALAPVVFLDHIGPGIATIAKAGPLIEKFLKILQINEIFADGNADKKLMESFCTLGKLTEKICTIFPVGIITGINPNGIESEFIPLLFAQYFAGISRKTLEHYDQIYFSGKFAQFDYGPSNNVLVYGEINPPEYDLRKVSTKAAILYGENDMMATMEDVHHLGRLLPNLVCIKPIKDKMWTHIDFTWGKEADKYLFGHIIELLNKNGR